MSLKSIMVNSLKNGVLPPDHRQLIMVVERKRVDRLETKEPAHTKVSPFRPTIEKKGANEFPTHKIRILHIDFVIRGLS